MGEKTYHNEVKNQPKPPVASTVKICDQSVKDYNRVRIILIVDYKIQFRNFQCLFFRTACLFFKHDFAARRKKRPYFSIDLPSVKWYVVCLLGWQGGLSDNEKSRSHNQAI